MSSGALGRVEEVCSRLDSLLHTDAATDDLANVIEIEEGVQKIRASETDAASIRKLRDGVPGKGERNNYSMWCRQCFREFRDASVTRCSMCGNEQLICAADRHAELAHKVQLLKTKRSEKLVRQDRWHRFQSTRNLVTSKALGNTDYARWSKWEPDSTDDESVGPVLPRNDPAFQALEADFDRREADRVRLAQIADRCLVVGRRLAADGKFARAIDQFEEGLEALPTKICLLMAKAHAEYRSRRFAECISTVSKAIHSLDLIDPVDSVEAEIVVALSLRASACRVSFKYDDAMNDYSRILTIRRTAVEVQVQIDDCRQWQRGHSLGIPRDCAELSDTDWATLKNRIEDDGSIEAVESIVVNNMWEGLLVSVRKLGEWTDDPIDHHKVMQSVGLVTSVCRRFARVGRAVADRVMWPVQFWLRQEPCDALIPIHVACVHLLDTVVDSGGGSVDLCWDSSDSRWVGTIADMAMRETASLLRPVARIVAALTQFAAGRILLTSVEGHVVKVAEALAISEEIRDACNLLLGSGCFQAVSRTLIEHLLEAVIADREPELVCTVLFNTCQLNPEVCDMIRDSTSFNQIIDRLVRHETAASIGIVARLCVNGYRPDSVTVAQVVDVLGRKTLAVEVVDPIVRILSVVGKSDPAFVTRDIAKLLVGLMATHAPTRDSETDNPTAGELARGNMCLLLSAYMSASPERAADVATPELVKSVVETLRRDHPKTRRNAGLLLAKLALMDHLSPVVIELRVIETLHQFRSVLIR